MIDLLIQVILAAIAQEIAECTACVNGVRLCQHHQRAADAYLPDCNEDDCWTCAPPHLCGTPTDRGVPCMAPASHAGNHVPVLVSRTFIAFHVGHWPGEPCTADCAR